jgi:hypothetical protein
VFDWDVDSFGERRLVRESLEDLILANLAAATMPKH